MKNTSPAPWKFIRHQDAVVIKDKDNNRICFLEQTLNIRKNERIIPNATLITAAPEMLEALESLREVSAWAYDHEVLSRYVDGSEQEKNWVMPSS
jgi:hypothetical protein